MEQRKARRFDLCLPFELVRGGARPLSEQGETKNLSSSGVLFRTNAGLRVGELVEYFITLPTAPKDGRQVRLRCVGKVVRHSEASEIAATLERYEFIR